MRAAGAHYLPELNHSFHDDEDQKQDLSQQVLMSVSSVVGQWEKRGAGIRFRHWLRKVTRNAIVNALSRSPQDAAAGGTSHVQVFSNTGPHLHLAILLDKFPTNAFL